PPAPIRTGSRLRRIAHPAGLMPGFVLMLGIMPYAAFASYAPGHAEDVGLDDAGTVFTVYAATVLIVRLVGAKVPDRLGLRTTSTAALVTIATGMLLMATLQTPWGLHLAAGVYAVGQSLLYPALFAAAVNSVGDDERSQVVATFTMFFDISTGIGGLVLGVVAGFGGPVGAFLAGSVMATVGLLALQALLADRADQSSDGSSRQTSSSPTARSS
ncbi:MAG: MFS transporter, partial [Actinomycetota bacterium]